MVFVARRLVTLVLGLALTLAVVACGSEDSTAAQYAQVTVTANTGSTPELGPQGVPTTPEGLSGVTSAQVSVTRDGAQLYFDENGNESEFGSEWMDLVGAEPVATLNLVHGYYVFTVEALGGGSTIADGRLEHTVSDDSHVRVPLVSILGDATFSDPVQVVPNQIYDLFLHVSPPGHPDYRVPTSNYNAGYWADGMGSMLSSSDLGVRMLANCEETTVHGDIYRLDEYTNPLRIERFIPLSESCPTAGGTVGVDILPPFVAIDPPASTEIVVGQAVVLTGDVNDAQTGIYQVTVYDGAVEFGGAIITESGQPDEYDTWEMTFTPDTARDYNLTVIAADGAGNETMRTITLTAVADDG